MNSVLLKKSQLLQILEKIDELPDFKSLEGVIELVPQDDGCFRYLVAWYPSSDMKFLEFSI